ncbi:MAG: exodeoxyribonuclease VII large subunit, partial [Candidatus Methanoperedens sp.]
PSAAAELAVPDRAELANHVGRLGDRLIENQRRNISDLIARASELAAGVEPRVLMERIADNMQYIDEITQRQILSVKRIMESKKSLFNAHAGKLDAVSPLGTLLRGYSITLKLPEETLVRNIGDVEKKDELSIIVTDGKIKCKVNDKEVCTWK